MLTLNLAKLSYTADLASDVPQRLDKLHWKHILNELVVVFDTFRSCGSSFEVMRILQASELLYEIPIEEMINEGRELMKTLALHGTTVKCDQLPASAIIKCPLLALRYFLRGQGKIRRIQMRFASTREYDLAIDHLGQLGLNMNSPQSSRPVAPTNPTRTQSGGPSCPPSQLSEMANRPFTAIPAAASSLHHQPQDMATRPFSARSPNSDPLTPPVYFPRPGSASSVPTYERFSEPPVITENSLASVTQSEPAILLSRSNPSDLPPRRELPFYRPDSPKSRGSDTVRPGSRSSCTLMGPPPLPLPTRGGGKKPDERARGSHIFDLPPLPKPTILGNIHAGPQTIPGSTKRSSTRAKSAIAAEKEKPPFSSSSPPFRPVTSDGMASMRPLSALGDATQHERQSKPQAVLPTPPASETIFQSHLDVDGNRGAENVANALAEYAMQNSDERMVALNSFVFQHLEDDNFLKLVEDLEVCWARIAPGMG